MITSEFIDELQTYLDYVDNLFNENAKNSMEKINIMTKVEELVFWLEQYKSNHNEVE